MDNTKFLNEFDYFKTHPEEYKHRHSGLGFLVSLLFIFGYIAIFCVSNSTNDQELKEFLNMISSYYLLFSFIISMSYFVYISVINKRVDKFDNMKYIGLASDLFEDINHIVIKDYTEQLRADIAYRGGICGNTALKIHFGMSDEAMLSRTKNKTIADLALDELEKAHGFRKID